MQTSSKASLAKQADPEDALLARMQSKGKMDKGKAVAIAKSRGWVAQSGRHLELTAQGKKPRDNAVKHEAEEKQAMQTKEARRKMAAYATYLTHEQLSLAKEHTKYASHSVAAKHSSNAQRLHKFAAALQDDKISFVQAIKLAWPDYSPESQYKIARHLITGLQEKIACSGNYRKRKKKQAAEKQAVGGPGISGAPKATGVQAPSGSMTAASKNIPAVQQMMSQPRPMNKMAPGMGGGGGMMGGIKQMGRMAGAGMKGLLGMGSAALSTGSMGVPAAASQAAGGMAGAMKGGSDKSAGMGAWQAAS
jgi:hypothetical protein